MNFDIYFMLFMIGLILAILAIAILAAPGPKKTRK